MLRKVNFSGNPLGSSGVEILARVFIRSKLGFPDQSTALSEGGRDSSVVSRIETLPSGENGRRADHFSSISIYDTGRRSAHSGDQNSTPQPQDLFEIASESNRRHFCKTRGLRAVPDFGLTGIPLSATGVIHLASILCMQESREFLCFYLPKTKVSSSQPETAEKNLSINWDRCEHLIQDVRQLLSWATTIAQQAPSFYRHTLAVAINQLETPPIPVPSYKGRGWKGRSDRKFQSVTKKIYDLATDDEVRASEIWGIALQMAIMVGAVLSSEEIIQVSGVL
ncbi:uncharacterized protein N7479_001823 [Penicillium vulpinum]|uniref:uncharacterized protein n=1 Tax=Penicillium vulpinum TaxID=29845 RepID=UPI002548773D|nr:uncharacterized protein N7479_001823 [Penicillium vulpinum]KAJ5971905.1 hypothetical protein N7479_001823 [Penicillium vulpinum]